MIGAQPRYVMCVTIREYGSTIREYGNTLYVGKTRGKMAAKLNMYNSFMLKCRLKLSSKPHEATVGLFYL